MANITTQSQLTLLQEMHAIAMDHELPIDTRLNAAKIVMPYLHKKMPVSSEVEIKGNEGLIAALKDIYGTYTPPQEPTNE